MARDEVRDWQGTGAGLMQRKRQQPPRRAHLLPAWAQQLFIICAMCQGIRFERAAELGTYSLFYFFFRICIRKSSCRLNQLQLTLGTACCIPIPMTLVESSSSKRRVQSLWHTIRQAGGGWANVGCATCAALDCASLQLAAAVVAHAVTKRGGATNWEVKALEGRLWNTLYRAVSRNNILLTNPRRWKGIILCVILFMTVRGSTSCALTFCIP